MITTINNDWYKDFFSGLNCELWERAVSAEWTTQEVDFLINTLHVEPGAALLDVQCGNGRHTIELAKRGFQLTGLDISAEFLQILKERTKAEQLAVETIEGDLLTTALSPSFDGAYCLGNGFGYVNYEGMNTFVRNVSAALKPNARFIINSGLVAESILTNFPKTNRYVLGDLIMDIHNLYSIEDSCMVTELTYTQGELTEKHYFKHYVFTLSEIKRLLQRHGLRTIAVYNSTDMTDYQLGDQQMYLVAEKQ